MTFICVFLAGGWLFGVLCLVLGCILGHQSGERQVAQLRADADKAHALHVTHVEQMPSFAETGDE